MKGVLISLAVLVSVAARADDASVAVPQGLPAKLNVAGKALNVFLKECDGTNLTFRIHKRNADTVAPVVKISGIEFVLTYEASAVQTAFIAADYPEVISLLAPIVEPCLAFMAISNNLQNECASLMQAYRETGQWDQMKNVADALCFSTDPSLKEKAVVNLALMALKNGDIETVQRIQATLESEAAKAYLTVCMERAQGDPKAALKTAARMIYDFPNDMDWLPPNELMCAQLYFDYGLVNTNFTLSTNSAVRTARQVSNLYAGTHIAGDAMRLTAGLEIVTEEQTTEMEGTNNE